MGPEWRSCGSHLSVGSGRIPRGDRRAGVVAREVGPTVADPLVHLPPSSLPRGAVEWALSGWWTVQVSGSRSS